MGGESFTWLVFETNKSKSLVVTESEYKNNLIKAKTDKSQKDTLWRLCKKANESIDNFVNCCGKLAQTEYKKQDDNLGKIVHWKLARKCDFEAGGK